MRVAVSGSHGLIGGRLMVELRKAGHEVTMLQRASGPVPPGAQAAPWLSAGRDVDAVVHLAGSPIAAGRWSARRKREILASREAGTRRLIEALAGAGARPRVFVSASAVGYYGPCGDEALDEQSPPGRDFLAGVCVAWEDAALGAAQALGARVVHLRTGVVLTGEGGMLARLLPFFRLGLGGPVGSGRQWLPWITLEDEVRAIMALLQREDAAGAYNLCAPSPARSDEFAHALGRVLRRPAVLPLPSAAVRLMFGEMGEAVLLAGQRALPRKLEAAGFTFREPALDSALRHCLQG